MVALFLYLFLALFVSFLCSVMESVLLSAPQPFLVVKQNEGHKWAKSFIDLKTNIDRPLSAILSLNTLAHTIGAAGVGAQAVEVFGEAYFGVVSAALTILILVLTEIIPKTIGANYWRNLTMISYYAIKSMIVITYPLVLLSAMISRTFSRDNNKRTTSREEIAALASIGEDEGLFSEKESKIIQNILKLKNVKASDILTPRIVVAVADEDLKLKEFLKNKNYLKFSRIPVYSQNSENITGYVFRQNVFEKLAEKEQNLRLKDIKRPVLFVPDQISLFTLWEKLLCKKEHISVIVDEYGGVEGIVTMEDIIETLLGLEIVDEKDEVTDMQKFARDRWKSRQTKYDLIEEVDGEERLNN